MNFLFIPTPEEEKLIQIIQRSYRQEFTLVRMTFTMLDKSIIDANQLVRKIFSENGIIEYEELQQGKIYKKQSLVLVEDVKKITTSFYRPSTKKGDPRFWPYKLKQYVKEGDLVYLTSYDNQVLLIPLNNAEDFDNRIKDFFGERNDDDAILNELINKIAIVKQRGWIKSVSPNKLNPKDVGDTLEIALGLSINNLAQADFKGEIEIKAKRFSSKTRDSLFSRVPNWEISEITSSAEMIMTYGYLSTKHPGFFDLYVTVNNSPNRQGLLLQANDASLVLEQLYTQDGNNFIQTCKWDYEGLKTKLYEKHPKTVWIVAHNEIINNEIHFKYDTVQLTQKPIFSQFISLIGQGIITYDWRGKVLPNNTKYRDHGHGFRLLPSKRNLLFGSTKMLEF